MRLQLPVAALLALIGAGWCSAADSTTSTDPSTTTASSQQLTPQAFVDQASRAGAFEVQSSQLAMSKGVDQKTRDFAQMMITDHQKAGQQLQQIAQQKGLMVKQDLGDMQPQYDKLQAAIGDDFTKQYVKVQTKAHQDAVALFKRASSDLQDPELKQFAAQTLPTLENHLAHAQLLKREEKSSMRDGARQGGSQSGGLGSSSDTWSSQSSAPGATLDSSAPASPSQSDQQSSSTTTIDPGVYGAPTTSQPSDQSGGASGAGQAGSQPSTSAGPSGDLQSKRNQDPSTYGSGTSRSGY